MKEQDWSTAVEFVRRVDLILDLRQGNPLKLAPQEAQGILALRQGITQMRDLFLKYRVELPPTTKSQIDFEFMHTPKGSGNLSRTRCQLP